MSWNFVGSKPIANTTLNTCPIISGCTGQQGPTGPTGDGPYTYFF